MNKKFSLHLTEDQMDLLLMGLRYLELSHPSDNPDYKPEFKGLLNDLAIQLNQTKLFGGAD